MPGTELTVILLATCIGMFVKSVTGMGFPLFAIPLIALVAGVETAVVVVSLPNVVANVLLCWQTRSGARGSRDLMRLGVSGVAGAVLGAIALVTLPEWILLGVLVVTIVWFVVQYWRSPHLRIDEVTSHRWSPVVGAAAGVMQGAVGVSGPVIAAWLHGYRLDRKAQVFSMTLLFLVSGVAQAASLAAAGAYTQERLITAAIVSVPVLVMIPVGARVRARLSGPGFDRAVLGVLVVSAFALTLRMFSS